MAFGFCDHEIDQESQLTVFSYQGQVLSSCDTFGKKIQHTRTLDQVTLYTREVLKRAFELNAASLIVVHNHPSGDPTPSQADIALTKHLKHSMKFDCLTILLLYSMDIFRSVSKTFSMNLP